MVKTSRLISAHNMRQVNNSAYRENNVLIPNVAIENVTKTDYILSVFKTFLLGLLKTKLTLCI